jgi:hypothetical protein
MSKAIQRRHSVNQQKTILPGLEAVLTAHKGDEEGLVLVSLTAAQTADALPTAPMKIALVIDRSGSMSGEKLAVTKISTSQFIRSLAKEDQVSLVTYDDAVDLVRGPGSPTEGLAQRVEEIEPGGATNLYGGWVTGAKSVGRGGRVILLSDGLANKGKVTDAGSLSHHASISYQEYGVTTTTVGVGSDYDEGLMAGMARSGGGGHYFARTAAAISDAFSQERYSAGSVFLEGVSVRCNGVTEQFGHFWGGETKRRIVPVRDLAGLKITVRYTDRASGKTRTEELSIPAAFGYSEEVRLEHLLLKGSEAEAEMLRVRDPKSASEMREQIRLIVLKLLSHPSSDEPTVAAAISRFRASMERLEQLERNYNETEASMHRKRSMQHSSDVREPAKAYSSFVEERRTVMLYAASASPMMTPVDLTLCKEALRLAPIEKWIEWKALPIDVTDQTITVAFEDPRRGFAIADIEKHVARKVKPVFANKSAEEIVNLLRSA